MSPDQLILLPKSARELVALIGLPAALKLIKAYPGQTLAIAKGRRQLGAKSHAALAAVIGGAAAKTLCHTYGGLYLYIPKCYAAALRARDSALHARYDELTKNGQSSRAVVQQLVREFGPVDSTIWRILKRPSSATAAPNASQPGLF